MSYPDLTAIDLAEFSGRELDDYELQFASTAIKQALLLFRLGTCLTSFPEDEWLFDLAKNAVLSMAEAITLVQPFQTELAKPFSSESIGSYSYSKVQGAVANQLPTGVGWFDMAVLNIGVCDASNGDFGGGGIEVFENDGVFVRGVSEANVRLTSPRDFDGYGLGFQDPSL